MSLLQPTRYLGIGRVPQAGNSQAWLGSAPLGVCGLGNGSAWLYWALHVAPFGDDSWQVSLAIGRSLPRADIQI